MTASRIRAAGDSALVLRLGDTIDPVINRRALEIAARLRERQDAAVRDVVVGYASVTVYFDPLVMAPAVVGERLEQAERSARASRPGEPRRIAIPTVYGGDAGPDLPEVAAFASCGEDEVIARHSARAYRVYLLGFLPGFPYMGLVDERIAMPRRDSPRPRVPAGSVGIAGRQTGVYPTTSPGGWRLIGRTEVALFDPERAEPAWLRPGDTVRFTPA